MKRTAGFCFCLIVFCLSFLLFGNTALAESDGVIKNGIYAGEINLSGMTAGEASAAVSDFVAGLREVEITLIVADENTVKVKAGDLGISWANTEIVEEALGIGSTGNVIERYKKLKDLQHENKIYPIKVAFDIQAINDILVKKCSKYDRPAVNAKIYRENGAFQLVEGEAGYALDVETSIDRILDKLTLSWNFEPITIALDVTVTQPKGKTEDLASITDVLGTYTTSYKTSGSSRRANVENGCRLINGLLLYPGDEFSMTATVTPFSTENGYYLAGSYLNGKVVDSLGGGICQVSTTLYNAVLLAEFEVTERHNHSMIVSYVAPSADAAIAENGGKNFRFVNSTDYPIYIEGVTKDRNITFTIYGRETRDSGHSVRYESEVVEKTEPTTDTIYADGSQPIGYIVTDSAHIGYKAKLWKIVTENGKEVSRTQVNSSTYKMVPRSATVGTATSNPADYDEIIAAINTGSIDHVKNVIAYLSSRDASNSVEIGEQ